MDDCIFCKLAAGDLGTQFLYEDDNVVAFNDLNPQAPVHALVIPKAHYASVLDVIPGETWESIQKAIIEVARQTGVDASGFRLIANTGDDAGQTVHHFHIHVLGGEDMGEVLIPR